MDGKKIMTSGVAYLSNSDDYTTFSFANQTIKFLTGSGLKRYLKIKEWKKEIGYLVVDCENADSSIEEDYIDLVPILKNLYVDPDVFLRDIKEVHLNYVD